MNIEAQLIASLKMASHLALHTWFGYFILSNLMQNERFYFLQEHLRKVLGSEVRPPN